LVNGLAARKNKSRGGDRRPEDQANKDRHQASKSENDRHRDDGVNRETNATADHSGNGRHGHRAHRQEQQVDDASNDSSAVSKNQKSDQSSDSTSSKDTTSGGTDTTTGNSDTTTGDGDTTTSNSDTATSNSETTTGGGGVHGGRGNGGGHDTGNAGSGFFDSPLATKAHRRADDFNHADPDDDGTFADVHADGDSVYETDSVSLTTGPDGLEIVTRNITYFADPTPEPEPLLRLELPDHEPGFPFGEDFPFGNATVAIAPAARGPSGASDTGAATGSRAEPIPTNDQSELISSDGGDYTTDFLS